MGNLIGNSRIYNIHAENEVAEILSHFNSELIRSVIASKIESRFNYSSVIDPVNDIGALEKNFNQIIDSYPEEQQQIWEKRCSTFQEIIDYITQIYNLDINPAYESRSGNYMEALLLYDFFISRYMNNAIEFFSNEIIKNTNSIYKYLNIDERREATIYAKKVYTANPKLAVLANNIDMAIGVIAGFDYELNDIFKALYTIDDYNILSMYVSDRGDFFKQHYVGMLNSQNRAVIITEIKMAIHAKYVAENGIAQSPINNVVDDKQ